MAPRVAIVVALFASACGPSEPAEIPDAEETPPVASASAAPAPEVAPSAAPSAPPAASEDDTRATDRLADRLMQGWAVLAPFEGGRAFAVVTSFAEEGSGIGTVGTIVRVGAEDDEVTLCEPASECEGDDEAIRAAVRAWAIERGLTKGLALEPVEFAADKGLTAATIGAIGGKLVWRKDHVDVVRGFKSVSLPKLSVEKELLPRPFRAVASPDGADLLVMYEMDPGTHYKEGFNLYVDAKAYKTP